MDKDLKTVLMSDAQKIELYNILKYVEDKKPEEYYNKEEEMVHGMGFLIKNSMEHAYAGFGYNADKRAKPDDDDAN